MNTERGERGWGFSARVQAVACGRVEAGRDGEGEWEGGKGGGGGTCLRSRLRACYRSSPASRRAARWGRAAGSAGGRGGMAGCRLPPGHGGQRHWPQPQPHRPKAEAGRPGLGTVPLKSVGGMVGGSPFPRGAGCFPASTPPVVPPASVLYIFRGRDMLRAPRPHELSGSGSTHDLVLMHGVKLHNHPLPQKFQGRWFVGDCVWPISKSGVSKYQNT